jgi:hypothetical protein
MSVKKVWPRLERIPKDNSAHFASWSLLTEKKKFNRVETWEQGYKTFYGRKLQIFVMMFVPGKPFQNSLLFVGKAKSLP